MRKRYSVNAQKAYNHQLRMLKTGRKFAKFLPEGYRLLGVDPGYLFGCFLTTTPRGSIDLSEEVVDTLLKHLRR